MSRVAAGTDKAGRLVVKGTHAEEKHFLISVFSGHIVKNYMAVTDM